MLWEFAAWTEGYGKIADCCFPSVFEARIYTAVELRRDIPPHVYFAELAEVRQRTWLFQVLGFMHNLDSMAESSLHTDIWSDNIHDALCNPACCNIAAGAQKHYATMSITPLLPDGRVHSI